MDDRFLSRGKSKDNDEWVEGLLTIMWGQYYIINPADENTAHCIDIETLGGCTGLTDKNGKLIFDGDRVLAPVGYLRRGRIVTVGMAATVLWDRGTYYGVWDDKQYGRHLLTSFQEKDIEIIGNIHDNPELLQESEAE